MQFEFMAFLSSIACNYTLPMIDLPYWSFAASLRSWIDIKRSLLERMEDKKFEAFATVRYSNTRNNLDRC